MNQAVVRYHFGQFVLAVPRMILTCGDVPVKLGGRALNLLAVLAEAGGSLVTREQLLERVWPGQSIDDSAIRVHLSAARKVLAEGGAGDAIVNEAGRGYRLALPVRREEAADAPAVSVAAAPSAPSHPVTSWPVRLGSVWGRDTVIATLADELARRRFITIAGPGGIGKTTVGLAVATAAARAGGIVPLFVDFAPLDRPAAVAATLATTLGLPALGGDPIERIAAALAAAPTLLLFDNCEHVVESAAIIAEDLLRRVPTLTLLATSREPLRAEGEWVHRLPALEIPASQAETDLAAAAAYPAISLFAELAGAVNATFELTSSTLPAVIDICRRLDGIPLAIELAAARSDLMDPAMIAAGLDDRFGLLTRGRRTALPRHQTLRAALDWSYALLDPVAQRLLDRLALFRATFDSEAAIAIAGGCGLSAFQAREAMGDLVAKSLVSAAAAPTGMRYRLLDTTRHYGLSRLEDTGEERQARQHRASFLASHFAHSNAAWEGKAPREWLATYSGYIDDARSALSWAAQDGGAQALAVDLLIKSAPLWFHLSLAREFLGHAETAIAALEGGAVDEALQIALLASYGHALWHTRGPVPEMGGAFARALALAENTGSSALILRAAWGAWAHRILAGDYLDSLKLADRFVELAAPLGEHVNRMAGERMRALSLHFTGDHDAALTILDSVMVADAGRERANHANYAQVDGKIAAMALLMRLHWLRADADLDTAMTLARACAEDAAGMNHALSACYGLAIGCIPVAIAAGETVQALAWIDALASHTRRHGLDHWHVFVVGFGNALGRADPMPAEVSPMQAEMFAVAAGGAVQPVWATAAKMGA